MIESGVSGFSWFSFLLGFFIVIFPLVDRIHTIELLLIDVQLMKDDIILSGKFYWFEFDFICYGNLAVFWFWLRLLLRLLRGELCWCFFGRNEINLFFLRAFGWLWLLRINILCIFALLFLFYFIRVDTFFLAFFIKFFNILIVLRWRRSFNYNRIWHFLGSPLSGFFFIKCQIFKFQPKSIKLT